MTEPASNCCRLPLKAPEKDVEEIKGATASLTAAKEASVDAAITTVFLELSGEFSKTPQHVVARG